MTLEYQINIGCSTKLGIFYKKALEHEAREKEYDLNLIDLSQDDRIHWEHLDGVFIPDGPDINPCYFLNSVEGEFRSHVKELDRYVKYTAEGKKRDAFEHGLLMEYFHTKNLEKVPILGICRGMQMLAVAQGIPLYLDLKHGLGMSNSRFRFDKIEVVKNESTIQELFEGRSFKAYKLQHQAINAPYFFEHKDRWPQVELTAFSHDQAIPEVIEFKNRPVLGVQFHPELSFGIKMKNIFKWFLDHARERKEARRHNIHHYA